MNTFRRSHALMWFFGLALLAASVAGAGWVLHSSAGYRTGSAAADETNGNVRRVVCFGHVDLEGGIASLYPTQPGRVEHVHVKENQEVKAGDVLISLDKRQAQLLVKQAQADLNAAQIQLELAKKGVDQQRIKETEQQAVLDAVRFKLQAADLVLSRMVDLRNLQTNDKEIEAARARREELKAVLRGEEKKLEELKLNDPHLNIRRAQSDVAAKQARLDQAALGLSECDLTAPADGTVLRVLVSRGEMLGSAPKQPAVLFCPKGPRIIRAEVEQEFASWITEGQSTSIQDDTRATGTWRGKVLRISDWYTHRRSILQEPLQWNDVRTLECIIALDPGQPPLRIGQRVRVTIGNGG
jgi:multidrug resistance efflux pump